MSALFTRLNPDSLKAATPGTKTILLICAVSRVLLKQYHDRLQRLYPKAQITILAPEHTGHNYPRQITFCGPRYALCYYYPLLRQVFRRSFDLVVVPVFPELLDPAFANVLRLGLLCGGKKVAMITPDDKILLEHGGTLRRNLIYLSALYLSGLNYLQNRFGHRPESGLHRIFADRHYDRVLDLGCGGAQQGAWLSGSYRRMIRLDFFASSGVDIRACATRLPLKDGSFDGIWCTSLLEHVPRPQECLNECYRVLKPGGRLFLMAPFIFPGHDPQWDYFRFSELSLRHMSAQSGFEVEELAKEGGYLTQMALIWERGVIKPLNGMLKKSLLRHTAWTYVRIRDRENQLDAAYFALILKKMDKSNR